MPDLAATSARIEELLADFEQADPAVRSRAEELVSLLAELYGDGLARVVELLSDSPDLLARLAADPQVAGLLSLHGLHPQRVADRVQAALDQVRPYLGSHAGGVELLGVDDDGVARLRLQGSCDGCAQSTVTVKLAIEKAVLDAVPEVVRVEVENVAEPGLIPVESLFQACPTELTARSTA